MKKIKLTKGKFAKVDDEDYEYLNQWKWYASHSPSGNIWYAQRSAYNDGKRRTIKMHRLIMDANNKNVVDHIDGDGLNNCKSNLRECSQRENVINGYVRRGMNKDHDIVKINGVWKVRIFVGEYKTKKDAIEARKKYLGVVELG